MTKRIKRLYQAHALAVSLVAAMFGGITIASPALAQEDVAGSGIQMMGPNLPTVFHFSRDSVSCSVSFGTLGAVGPGPHSDPQFKLKNVNFGMIVASTKITSYEVSGNTVTIKGTARSLTTVNEKIIENAIYNFTATAVDGGPPSKDTFSMTLKGEGLLFNGATFTAAKGTGLVSGDLVIGS